MSLIEFGIVGRGWRADFYLRIAKLLPHRFAVRAMLVRDEERGREIEKEWEVKTYRDIESFVSSGPLMFAVLSVSRDALPVCTLELAERNIPILTETPPANDIPGMIALYESLRKLKGRVQVAEQYLYQPMHAARIAFVRSGKLGDISQVQVSAAHGYHGISLIRKMLGISFENAIIRGQRFTSKIVKGPGRYGPPESEVIDDSVQDIATLQFGNQLALFDFTGDQYFSWIRQHRVLVRGSRGEVTDETFRYLKDYKTPVYGNFRRVDTGHNGNLEGYYHRGITANEDWVYENLFVPGRLSDDEIAIATSLTKMADYLLGGPSCYDLAEAMQDNYLSIMMQTAIESGEELTTTTQPWAL
ncbi:Gfo/Idh/MocA family protein [Paenibacillus aceris]|uniref:Dehydrogenase n=1 Tax=Paenibacillus aceris TaxID=869555 RepID=A0ABS4HX56_9BACL|nr:Gfo/Idh/MocA family oxidoreductase [Paenibacillus aceris]MBP1963213.1 putative dehydrogenase [Paenibacillus aceris]NHW38671.1 Gfo/Idh/MocA family oxidoreductase [Paenibacillus aceris]